MMKTDAIEKLLRDNSQNEDRLLRAMDKMQKALELVEYYKGEGELIQTEFKRVKEAVGRFFDDVKGHDMGIYSIKPRIPYNEQTKDESAIDDIPLDRRGVNKYLRALKAVNTDEQKPEVAEYVKVATSVFEELAEINKETDSLKDLVVKKKRDAVAKADNKAKEEAQRANHADVVKVREFLTKLTNDGREQIFQEILSMEKVRQQRKLDYLESVNYEIPSMKKRGEPDPQYNFAMLRSVMKERDGYSYGEGRTYIIHTASPEELEARVNKEAKMQTDLLLDQYVHRVTEKLAFIIAKKNCLDSISCSELKLTHAIEANLDLKFKDNSSFTLVTTTEMAANPVNPGYHIKIPSRFTDVIKADGSKMKSPSEKNLQDELAM